MGTEALTHPVLGHPVFLLWLLLLLPLATSGQQRSPFTPAPASGETLERGAPTSIFQQLVPGTPVCGKPKVMGKIYGGQDVVAGQWPWQASLLYRNLHICGAVLIDSFWLVSTAHCFLNKSHFPEDYQILLGTTQLYQHTQHTQKMAVNRIIMHPDFEKFHPFGSDIAMLQLHLPVNFTSYISPACLPNPGVQLPSHLSCWITGWGMLSEDSEGVWERWVGENREGE
ncbi:serine protease 47 [Phyllostomus discolor]|uniref:Serine protease 47 n=1 Tax=Phyllostomus discolor TaxID=89673 RepID=A0A834BAI7_9CHIR|nr:serine protease 47 [Phyllostomus discolor]